jgi:hypothetical protein
MKGVPIKVMMSPQAKLNQQKYSKLQTNVWLKRMKYHVDRQKERVNDKSPEPKLRELPE